MRYHFVVLLFCQLSYNHMHPIGWKHISVPRSAPISETRPPNTGIALAMTYAVKVTPPVQPNHVAQWRKVGSVRWYEPRSMRTKTYLAAICGVLAMFKVGEEWITYVHEEQSTDTKTRQSQTIADPLEEHASRAKGWRCHVASTVVVNHNTNDDVGDSNDRLAKEE